MDYINKKPNVVNLQKATDLYNELCEMAEENKIDNSILFSLNNYIFKLDLKNDVLEYSNNSNMKYWVSKKSLINILSNCDALTREKIKVNSEKSVKDINNKIIKDLKLFLSSCDYIEKVNDIIENKHEGDILRKNTIRNVKENTIEEKELNINKDIIEKENNEKDITLSEILSIFDKECQKELNCTKENVKEKTEINIEF